MTRDELLSFWRNFFLDLFAGTVKRSVAAAALGAILGAVAFALVKQAVFDQAGLSPWLRWPLLTLAAAWYAFWGIAHALAHALVAQTGKKLGEAVWGLHGLLDFSSHELLRRMPDLNPSLGGEGMIARLDRIGEEFWASLRLRGGVLAWAGHLLFGLFLRGLKWLFLNDVIQHLRARAGGRVTAADMESAVRRVGADLILSSILDYMLILRGVNLALMALFFSAPLLLAKLF